MQHQPDSSPHSDFGSNLEAWSDVTEDGRMVQTAEGIADEVALQRAAPAMTSLCPNVRPKLRASALIIPDRSISRAIAAPEDCWLRWRCESCH
jgi:hypothetical protein